MKRRSFFLHLFIYFYMLYPSSIQAIEFRRIDFERLVRNHPLMRRFDAGTGRFRGTPSEVRSIEDVRSDIARMDYQIQETERKKGETVKASFFFQNTAETSTEAAWHRINGMDAEIATLKKNRAALASLLEQGGVPPEQTLIDCVKSLAADILSSCPAASDSIVLNVFPRFPSPPPGVPAAT
ncbi:MAG TPA: hypothetical protein PKM25_12060, partial [Candidatus Ozemobacteraceae bacterium]|nr:hypothetical protein [Candidatus Ozemobacteraceae bacterium]